MTELKRKVTLKEKKSVDDKKSGGKLWLWLILMAVVAVVVILCIKFCVNDKESESAVVAQTEVTTPDETTVDAETSTDENQAAEDQITEPTPAKADEATAPATPADKPVDKSVAKPAEPAPKPAPETKPAPKPAPAAPQGSLDEKAMQVIRGEYGNGATRKQALGSEYDAIQQRVNEMYREGKVN